MASSRESDVSTSLLNTPQADHFVNEDEAIPLEPLQKLHQPAIVDQKAYQPVSICDFPDSEAVPNCDSNSLPPTKKRWITGLLLCALGVALALVAHIILMFKLAPKNASGGYDWGSPSSAVYEGTCPKAKQIATGLHVLINIIVLTLTATSSYCNQVLAAPSRARIDYAHSQRVWVSIGSSSFTNVWYAPLWRKILWLLILGTSFPIQMIYNSFIFVSVNANDYGMVAAPLEFRYEQNVSDYHVPPNFQSAVGMGVNSLHDDIISGKLEFMSNAECKEAYTGSYQTAHTTIVLLTPDLEREMVAWPCEIGLEFDGSFASLAYKNDSQGSCSIKYHGGEYYVSPPAIYESTLATDGDSAFSVHDCYSRKFTPTCEVGCSLPIGLTVLVCISLKLLCMLATALERRTEIFLTVGDAIASFLTCPDPYTANNCLMARTNKGQPKQILNFNLYPWVSVFSRAVPFRLGQSPTPQPKKIRQVRQRWFAALPRRLFAFLLFFKIALITMAGLAIGFNSSVFGRAGVDLNPDSMSSWEQKLTSLYHSKFYVMGHLNFIATVLAINVPQVIITIIYAVYNNTLTRILLAAEYNDFAIERKPLRVSFPTGEQRSTYYLSVPYRYSVPFLVLSTLAHWLASEAISLVQIVPRDLQGDTQRSRALHGMNASSIGLIIMVVPWLTVVVVFLVLLQFRKFKSAAMPIAMNCSAAISAACHPSPDDTDAAKKPVMWGQAEVEIANLHTFLGPDVADLETICRHTTFTSKEVVEPSPEFVYY